jgi:hypothetical protein
MALLAIKFTEETFPKIVKAFPIVKTRWDNDDIYREYFTADNYFVIDTEFKHLWRVLTLEHFEDVYEMSADEINEEFVEI